MPTFLKILLVVLVLIGGYRWYSNTQNTKEIDSTVTALAEALRDHPNEGPEDAAVRSLFSILALLQEPRPEDLQDTAIYVRMAAGSSDRLRRQSELLVEALSQNQSALRQLGLDNQEAALILITGRSPEIPSGPFAGETLSVGRRLSVLQGYEARFALPNLVIAPESVASALMPEKSANQDQLVRRFRMIGLLPKQ